MSEEADFLMKSLAVLESRRSNCDAWWEQIGYRVMPQAATFQHTTEEGEKRTERIFDSTAVTANERFAAFIGEGYTPRDQFWHGLEAEDEDLREDQDAREYYDAVKKLLFTRRYRPRANFTSQRHELYLSLGAFGNFVMFIDEDEKRLGEIRYRAIHMSECFWAEDHQGRVDTLYRKFPLEARQAVEKFGKDCPQKIQDEAKKNPFAPFDFLHAVFPNAERKVGRLDYEGMEFASRYVWCGDRQLVRSGGYRCFPYAIGRFMKGARETYARSPAMSCWGAILTGNEQKKTILRAGQKAVDPPTLLAEDGILEPFNQRPGAANYGMVTQDGSPLAVPYNNGAKVELGVELLALEQRAINDAFLVSLFQILAERPDMTATEVLSRMKEKAELLSPTTARLESEDAGPMIERELDILQEARLLPPMPRSVLERGGRYRAVYTSPLARARRAADAMAILKSFEAGTVIGTLDPDAKHVLKGAESLREIADINGMPAKLVRSPEEIEQLAMDEKQMMMAAAAAKLAPGVAQSAKNIAEAEQIRTQAA